MNTMIIDDWLSHAWPVKTKDGTEYSVTCHVYVRLKQEVDPLHWPPRNERVADYSLEGFDTLPAMRPEHEKEIERQLLVLLEEEYPL